MKPKIERQTVFYLKWILISLVTLILVQTLYTAHLQRANLFLKHEIQKKEFIEIPTMIQIEKECPKCFCPKGSYDCPAQ